MLKVDFNWGLYLKKKSVYGNEILSYFMKTLFESQLNYNSDKRFLTRQRRDPKP